MRTFLNPTHRWTYIPLQTTSQQDTNQIVSGPATRPATRTTEFFDMDTTEQLPALVHWPEQQLPEQPADSDSDFFDRLLKTPPATPPRPTAANDQQHQSNVYSSVDTHIPLFRGTDYNKVPPIPPIHEVRISTFNQLYKPQTFSRPGSAPTTRQCFPISSQPDSSIGLSVSGITPAEPIHRSDSYITTTELHDGQHALLVDPGSCNNLAGGEWVRRAARLADNTGKTGTETTKRDSPLHVSGVGTDSQVCHYNWHLPITLRDIHGNPVECTFTTPTINNSSLPALLGLNSLINVGAVMDFRNMKLHFTGPGPLEYASHLPEGTQTFELHQAPSGHVMLPCCKYATPQEQQRLRQQQTDTLTLHTTSTSSTTQPTTEPTPPLQHDININPWNAFQHRYKGQGLTKENFTVLYH